jgi:hypothetical protein
MQKIAVEFPKTINVPEHNYRLDIFAGGSSLANVLFGFDEQDNAKILSSAMSPGFEVFEEGITGEVCKGSKVVARLQLVNRFNTVASENTISGDANDEPLLLKFEESATLEKSEEELQEPEGDLVADEEKSDEDEAAGDAGDANEDGQKTDNDDAGKTEGQSDETTTGDLTKFNLTPHELSVLKKHNVTTLDQARAYFEQNKSFAPMKGLTEKSGGVLAVKLGLVK